MTEKDAYVEIADRSIEVAAAVANSHREASAFHSYHAFESIGGALCCSLSIRYPLSHIKKLKQFTHAAKRCKIGGDIAYAAILVASIRNTCLYPISSGTGFLSPKDRFSKSDSDRMRSRVGGVIRHVKKHL